MEDTLWLSNVPMLISSKDENCTSPEVGGVVWIWKIFHECVASPVQYAGFILGLFSLMCWIVLFMPQIYKNIKEGKMDEGVSFFFIFIWMLGDISNLLGCILAHQLPIQHIIAYYYCGMDTLMLGQFTFYTLKKKRKLRAMRPVDTEDSSINRSSYNQSAPLFTICCFFVISFGSQLSWQQSGNVYESRQNAGGRMLLGSPVFYDLEDIFGYVFGITSSLFYLSARIPQILQNYNRQSVEGLSMFMFIISVLGNSTYGCSILMQSIENLFILRHLPWLVGSLGTLVFDCMLLMQFARYGKQKSQETGTEEERKPLVEANPPVV